MIRINDPSSSHEKMSSTFRIHAWIAGLVMAASTWLVEEYPVPPLCRGIKSLSFNFLLLIGSNMSFLIIFSTHSDVTTLLDVFKYVQGTELPKMS